MRASSGIMTPPTEPTSPTESNVRKRVCKACDRCRLKKSKCDGASPCSRCRADNAICMFGERKRSQDKVYPKGYVEMLENQQAQLVAGVQELYRRLTQRKQWEGPLLTEASNGAPLIHEVLDRLGVLKQEDGVHIDGFEENLQALQEKLFANGAGFMQREMSFDMTPDTTRTSSFDTSVQHQRPNFTNPFRSHPSDSQTQAPASISPHASVVKTSSPLKSHLSHLNSNVTTLTIPQMPGFAVDPTDFINCLDDSYQEPAAIFSAQSMAYGTPYQYYTNPAMMTTMNPSATSMDFVMDDSSVQYCTTYTAAF